MHAIADLETFRGTREGAPGTVSDLLRQIEIDLRLHLSARTHARERRRNDARVVEDERVARIEQARQIANRLIGKIGIVARATALYRMHDQQARRIPRLGGTQRDGAIGQLEVEKVGAHRVRVSLYAMLPRAQAA